MSVGKPHNDVLRRMGQYDAYRDECARLNWSRELVLAKIHAQERVLKKALEERRSKRNVLIQGIDRIGKTRQSIETCSFKSIAELLGAEGAAAAAYFKGFSTLFPPSAGFRTRNRRPPRDPVNACLSLGYTLLHFEAVCEIYHAGLDPMLGLFHEPAYGRESLATDVIEPLRPHVDEWVWHLFRDRILVATAFKSDGNAVLIGKAGRRKFYEHFNPLGLALRRLLRRQIRHTVKELRERCGIVE